MQSSPRVLFARIGWMKYYSGSRADDERPIGGGSYNKRGKGSEICNFKPINGKIYGYFERPAPNRDPNGYGVVNIERIAPGMAVDRLEKVTVIFVATDPTIRGPDRQHIVGWYRDATVLRECRDDPTGQRRTIDPNGVSEACLYNVVALEKNAVLLPLFRRKQSVPSGRGGMGQSNARYLYDQNGKLSMPRWMHRTISYVQSYNGENWLTDPLAEVPRIAELEQEIAAGYESNPRIRAAVENRAMMIVKGRYESEGFRVENKSCTECYDFLCSKRNGDRYVEVKGTRTNGTTISLTANEVKLATKPVVPVDLCIVHSIRIIDGRKPRARGGKLLRFTNWDPRDHELRAVHYECRMTRKPASGRA